MSQFGAQTLTTSSSQGPHLTPFQQPLSPPGPLPLSWPLTSHMWLLTSHMRPFTSHCDPSPLTCTLPHHSHVTLHLTYVTPHLLHLPTWPKQCLGHSCLPSRGRSCAGLVTMKEPVWLPGAGWAAAFSPVPSPLIVICPPCPSLGQGPASGHSAA